VKAGSYVRAWPQLYQITPQGWCFRKFVDYILWCVYMFQYSINFHKVSVPLWQFPMRIGLGLGKYMLGFHGHACRQVAVIIPIPSMCNPYPKGSLSLNIEKTFRFSRVWDKTNFYSLRKWGGFCAVNCLEDLFHLVWNNFHNFNIDSSCLVKIFSNISFFFPDLMLLHQHWIYVCSLLSWSL